MAKIRRATTTVLRTGAFPVLAFALPAVGLVLLRNGAGPTMATLVPLAVAAGVVAILERVIPYERGWNRSRGDVGLDAAYLALTLLTSSVTQGIVAALAGVVRERTGAGAWPAEWPLVVQVGLALLVADLGLYLVHRASHASDGLLWRIHSVHHSADRMYWLNGGRFHPANVAYNVALKALPLALLGAPQETIVVTGLVSAIQAFLTHANLDLRAGFLNRVFSTPEVHRWHHARDVRDADANYGGTLVVWDVLFGTWSLPSRRLAGDAVGLQELDAYPQGLRGQLCHPLTAASRETCRVSWLRCCSPSR